MVDVGRFRREFLIQQGGQGEVWRAWDLQLNLPVALKIAPGASPEEDALLLREASLLSQIQHPALVRLIAHGKDPELGIFLALEWIEGGSLAQRLSTPVSITQAISLGLRLADALSALHGIGIVHGDLKPENVMLPEGSLLAAKLIDLGLARGEHGHLAPQGGTLSHAAPEVLLRQRSLAASDLFSLGVLLWEALTGELPFPGDSPGRAVLFDVVFDPTPLRTLHPDAPAGLLHLLEAMLLRDPLARPSARQVCERFLALGGRSVEAAPRPSVVGFWGRSRELVWLEATAREASRVVLISGPPGMGKTQLRLAWQATATREGSTLWEATGQHEAGPFSILRALLRAACQSHGLAPSAEELERFVLSAIAGSEGRMIFALLADLWNLSTGDAPDPLVRLSRGDPGLRSLLLEQSWLSLVQACRARGPLLFVVEDLHLADVPSLRLLEAAVLRTGVTLVAFSRPLSDSAALPFARCRVESLLLGPLEPAEAELLVRALWPEVTPAELTRVLEQGAGLPLFLAELASRQKVDSSVSPSLVVRLQERVDERSELEQRLLRAVALLGFQAPVRGVLAMLESDVSEALVRSALGNLVDAWLLQRGPDDSFAFRHETIREVILARAPLEDLGVLHARALAWLRHRGEQDALLGWHAEQANLLEEAAEHYAAASWRALGLDFLSAARFADRAIRCAPQGGAASRSKASRTMALAWMGRWEEATEAAAEACAENPPGSPAWVASASARCFGCFASSRFEEMRSMLEQLFAVEPDESARSLQIWALGINAYSLCYGPCSRDLGARCLAQLQRLLPPDAPSLLRASDLRMRAVVAYTFEGRLDEAIELSRKSIQSFLEAGDPSSALQGRVILGVFLLAVGSPQPAAEELLQTIEMSERIGARGIAGFAYLGYAEAMLALGRLEEALARALALPEIPSISSRRFVHGWALRILGSVHLAHGDAEEALRCANYAISGLGAPCRAMLAALVLRADAALALGDLPAALESATEAVRMVESPDPFVQDEVGARGCLAEILGRLGRHDEAEAILATARAALLDQASQLSEPYRALFLGRPQARRILDA